MNYRKGDKVSVLGIVKHNQNEDKNIFVDVIGSHDTLWLKPEDMTLVEPMFEVGDGCTFTYTSTGAGETTGTGVILAISDGHAWIDRGGGDYCTRMLTTIERVDSDEE